MSQISSDRLLQATNSVSQHLKFYKPWMRQDCVINYYCCLLTYKAEDIFIFAQSSLINIRESVSKEDLYRCVHEGRTSLCDNNFYYIFTSPVFLLILCTPYWLMPKMQCFILTLGIIPITLDFLGIYNGNSSYYAIIMIPIYSKNNNYWRAENLKQSGVTHKSGIWPI